jgi:hypothetical protein
MVYKNVLLKNGSLDSAVGTIGYGLKGRGVRVKVPLGDLIFLLSMSSRPVLGPAQPPIQGVPRAISPEVER